SSRASLAIKPKTRNGSLLPSACSAANRAAFPSLGSFWTLLESTQLSREDIAPAHRCGPGAPIGVDKAGAGAGRHPPIPSGSSSGDVLLAVSGKIAHQEICPTLRQRPRRP